MNNSSFGCPGLLRRHRRSGLQEDFSGAPGDGETRTPERARDRRGQGGMESRPASRAGAGQPGETRRSRSRGFRKAERPAALRGRRLPDPATFQAIRNELDGAQRPAYYLAIPPFYLKRWWNNWRSRAAPRALASSSRSHSAMILPRRRSSTGSCIQSSPNPRSFASTTISASGR